MSGTICHYGNNIADCWTRRRIRFAEYLLRVYNWYREWKNCTSEGSTSPWHFCTNRFRSSTQYSLMNTLTELCENNIFRKSLSFRTFILSWDSDDSKISVTFITFSFTADLVSVFFSSGFWVIPEWVGNVRRVPNLLWDFLIDVRHISSFGLIVHALWSEQK